MAEGTLSTQKLGRPSSGRALTPDLIRAGGGTTLATGSINPNAARINYVPAKIPQMVQDRTAEGLQHVMSVTSEAAFKYQERESTFYANEGAIAYEEFLNKEMYGYKNDDGSFTEGMLGSEGADSIRAHGLFTGNSEKRFDEFLSKMEPRVRQKALVKMAGIKNTYDGYAAKHRGQQMEVAEDKQRADEILRLQTRFTRDPGSMLGMDPTTGATGKQQHDKLFENAIDAKKSWSSVVHEVGKGIYTHFSAQGDAQAGINNVKQYYADIAGPELIEDGATSSAMKEDITAWTLKAVNQRNSQYNQARREEEDRRQDGYRAGIELEAQDRAEGKIPDASELLERKDAGLMSPERYITKMDRHYGNTMQRPDSQTKLEEAIANGDVTTREEIVNHPDARYWDDAFENQMIGFLTDVKNPDYGDRYRTAVSVADGMFAQALGMTNINQQMVDSQKPMMHAALRRKLKVPGKTAQQALIEILPQFNVTKLSLDKLPAIDTGSGFVKPMNIQQVNAEVAMLHNAWSATDENGVRYSKGNDSLYYENMLTLARYRQTFGALNSGGVMDVNPKTGEILNNPNAIPDTPGNTIAEPKETGVTPTGNNAPEPKTTPNVEPAASISTEEADALIEQITGNTMVEEADISTAQLKRKFNDQRSFDNAVSSTVYVQSVEDFPVAPTPEETGIKALQFKQKNNQLGNVSESIFNPTEIGNNIALAALAASQNFADYVYETLVDDNFEKEARLQRQEDYYSRNPLLKEQADTMRAAKDTRKVKEKERAELRDKQRKLAIRRGQISGQ